MNGIQETKTSVGKWNRLFDTVVTILKYNKSTIEHSIYIKVFSDGKVSYLMVYNDDVINITNDKTSFPELRRVF